jgi:hypothetical protein
MGFVFLKNSQWTGTAKKIGMFTWLQKYQYEPPIESPRKRAAQYPEVPEEYLSPKPEGLVIGYDKKSKQYIRYPLKRGNARSMILLGTPGSGKTTVILSSILAERLRKLKTSGYSKSDGEDDEDERTTYFLLDLKPEILKKCSMPEDADRPIGDDRKIVEISISDKSKYGWDPFYRIRGCCDDDDVLQQLDIISRALIDGGKGAEKNEFFYLSGQICFQFLALERWKKGIQSFFRIVKDILESDLQTEIKKVLERIKDRPEYCKIQSGLAAYEDKQGDAFAGIEMSMRQGLACMQRDDVEVFFSKEKLASPYFLEKKVSMALTIPSNQIKTFKTIVRLIVMQIIDHCEQRDEENSHLITLCLDEIYRLGPGICEWVDFLALCRSKNVSCWLISQSLSLFEKLYDKPTMDAILENCAIIGVLSVSSESTAKVICGWAGSYDEEKITMTVGGSSDGSYTRTFEQKKILEPEDLMDILDKQEVIAFINGRYVRGDAFNARYYRHPQLVAFSKKCLEAHVKQEREKNTNEKYK